MTSTPFKNDRDAMRLNVILLRVGYACTAPFVLFVPFFAAVKRDTFWEWLAWGGPLIAAAIVWLLGLILGVLVGQRRPWAGIRIARYAVILVAAYACWWWLAPSFPYFARILGL